MGPVPIVLGVVAVAVLGLLVKSRQSGPAALSALPKRKGPSMSSVERARVLAPAIGRWAAVFGAPVSLMMSIIGNESGFDSNAKNLTSPGDVARGGAWGLAQLTLKTALSLHNGNPKVAAQYWPQWAKTGLTGPGLLDPETNLAIAAFGIAQNWKRYAQKPHNWNLAGLAWNRGAGSADARIAAAQKSGNYTAIDGDPYVVHLLAQRQTNPLTAQVWAQEQASGRFKFA